MAIYVLFPALDAYLSKDATLISLIKGIFDEVPENEPFPFIVLGDITEASLDGYNQTRRNITITIHVWSQAIGMEEIEAIMERLSLLLHQKTIPSIPGYTCVSTEREFELTQKQGDGITRHGSQRYRFLIEKSNHTY